MTELNSIQTTETHQISCLSLDDTIESLTKQLTRPEYSKNSILQKPVLSKLITLSLSQNAIELHNNKWRFRNIFEHMSDDLILYMFEELSEHIETKGYTATFLTNEMARNVDNYQNRITDHQSLIKPLKNIFGKSIFDSNFNIPMTTLLPTNKKLPDLSIGSLVSNIIPIVCTCLRNSHKKMNDGQLVNKQTYEETFDFFKYLLMVPINLALKSQEYNTSICPQTFVTTTGNYQTILDSNTFKLGSSNLNLCLKTFEYDYYFGEPIEDNCKNKFEFIYQLLMSLICQSAPSYYPEELDKDIFNFISCYKFKTNYINILIKHYTRYILGICSPCSLSLKQFSNAFNIYSKVPCNNKKGIRKYLDAVDTFISYIRLEINPNDNIIDTKSFVRISKTLSLIVLNVYCDKQDCYANRAVEVLYRSLKLFSIFDKILFIRFVNYFADYMLDIFIQMFNKKNLKDYRVRVVLDTLINGIIELDEPMREMLLVKFDKWFVVILQAFSDVKNRLSNRTGNGFSTGHYNYYLNSYQLYFEKKVSIYFLVEKLSWFTSHDVELEILLTFINKTNKYICAETKPFSDIVKLHLASNLITNMGYNKEGGMIIPVNYQQLLDKIEREENEEFCDGIESLTQMYMWK